MWYDFDCDIIGHFALTVAIYPFYLAMKQAPQSFNAITDYTNMKLYSEMNKWDNGSQYIPTHTSNTIIIYQLKVNL